MLTCDLAHAFAREPTGFGGRQRRRREAPVAVGASERPAFDAPSVRDVEIDIPSFLKED